MKQISLSDLEAAYLLQALEEASYYRYDEEDPPECAWCKPHNDHVCYDHEQDRVKAEVYRAIASVVRKQVENA